MMQSRTHNCGELRAQHAGEHVKLVGWMENVREVGGSLAFVVLRDFYGTTQIVVETSELLAQIKGYNKESTISVEGTVRERASKNPNQPTGDIEVVPEKIELLGRCRYNSLPFEINRSREADETQRLKYRYLDLRNPAVKKNIILRCNVIAALRKAMMEHDFLEITTPILTASSPEGARDYLVPARKHPGAPASSISSIWRWRSPHRKTSSPSARTSCPRSSRSLARMTSHLSPRSAASSTSTRWKFTAPTSRTCAST